MGRAETTEDEMQGNGRAERTDPLNYENKGWVLKSRQLSTLINNSAVMECTYEKVAATKNIKGEITLANER